MVTKNEKLLTKGEVAQLCRVEVRTVDRWLVAGKIGCYRTPSSRVLFRMTEVLMAVDRWQEPRRSGSAAFAWVGAVGGTIFALLSA
jgi:excisionase family DNA binding protein